MTSQDSELRLAAALADRYRIEREIGHGGMATVYLAEDLRHQRPIALKVMHSNLAVAVGYDRFHREVRLTASLDHPHILPVLDSGEAAGQLWYTMPFVRGETLRERIRNHGQLPIAQAVELFRQIATAVAYAHRRDIVHRDLKPENILIADEQARVADFGIAKALAPGHATNLTDTGMALGTPAYMSPEQASAEAVDTRSDIYALSCILYEMLAGVPPFAGGTPQVIISMRFAGPPAPLRSIRPSISPELEGAVARGLSIDPGDRFQSAEEFVAAVESPDRGLRFSPSRMVAAAIAIAAIVLTGLHVARNKTSLDSNLLAVTPFDVVGGNLAFWREGLMDVLARNLDGSGPLRTVSPTVVMRRWRAGTGREGAAEAGRGAGASLVVTGQLIMAGHDSIRLAATLLDAASGRILGEVEVRDDAGRIDRAADSIAIGLLRHLGGSRPIGGVPRTTLTATSLPAMRAFLQGEQYYRRSAWDSARMGYEHSIALDSTFALPWRRLAKVLSWSAVGANRYGEFLMNAARWNEGLTTRESLLVVADSFWAAGTYPVPDIWGSPPDVGRHLAVLEQAAARYPEDPEVWYELGEAYHHFGTYRLSDPATFHEAAAAFDRSLALDSAFAPSYIHRMELALYLQGPEEFSRIVAAYRQHAPLEAAGAALAWRLLDQARDTGAIASLLDGVPRGILWQAYSLIKQFPDSLEAAVAIAARLASHGDISPGESPDTWRSRLALTLAYRGHLREARRAAGPADTLLLVSLAYLGALPDDTLGSTFALWSEAGSEWTAHTLAWWGSHGDTGALKSAAARAQSLQGRASPRRRLFWEYVHLAALAHLELARGEQARGLELLTSLPDSFCSGCVFDRLTRARLLAASGRLGEAAAILAAAPRPLEWYHPNPAADALWVIERARIARLLGDSVRADGDLRFIEALWRHADKEVRRFGQRDSPQG